MTPKQKVMKRWPEAIVVGHRHRGGVRVLNHGCRHMSVLSRMNHVNARSAWASAARNLTP